MPRMTVDNQPILSADEYMRQQEEAARAEYAEYLRDERWSERMSMEPEREEVDA